MKINIEISDNEIEQMIKSAIQDKVTEWLKEEINKYSSFRRYCQLLRLVEVGACNYPVV